MNNDLIAMTFRSQQAALDVRRALEMMRTSQTIGAMDVIPITKDREGNVIIHFYWQTSTSMPTPGNQIPGLVANSIFGKSSEGALQRLVDSGLDESFVKKLVTDVVPGSSLILGYITKCSLVSRQQFLDAVSQFRGTIYQTTISTEVEQAILSFNP